MYNYYIIIHKAFPKFLKHSFFCVCICLCNHEGLDNLKFFNQKKQHIWIPFKPLFPHNLDILNYTQTHDMYSVKQKEKKVSPVKWRQDSHKSER